MKTSDPLIILEYPYKCTVDELWSALTVHSEMLKWYFDNIPSFKAEKGFKTQFVVKAEDRIYTHQWEVIAVDTNEKIAYTWQFKEHPGLSVSSFEISKDKQYSKLILTIDVLQDFPSDIPEFKRASCIAGWDYFLGQRLKNYLEE